MKPLKLTNALMLAALLFMTLPGEIYADAPLLLNYQGNLTDAAGTPESGTFSMTFSVWDAATAGNPLPVSTPWQEVQSVVISDGVFNVLLGSVTPLPPGLFDGGPSDAVGPLRYLQVVVGGESLSPRKRIASAPYAINHPVAADPIFTCGETIGDRDVVYLRQSTGRIYRAQADSVSTMPAIGLTLDSCVTDGGAAVRLSGLVSGMALTSYATYYVDPLSAGGITAIEPTAGSIQKLGVAIDTSTLFLQTVNGSYLANGSVAADKALAGVVPGDILIHQNDVFVEVLPRGQWVKVSSITVGGSGNWFVRASFDLQMYSFMDAWVRGQVYRNGIPLGTIQTASWGGTMWGTFVEDLGPFTGGDTLELWCEQAVYGGSWCGRLKISGEPQFIPSNFEITFTND